MENNPYQVTLEKLAGKTVEDLAITDQAVVLKFTDGTFLDVYLDSSGRKLKTSTNKLEENG